MIYLPEDFIGLSLFMNEWQTWAKEAGLKGIYFFCCNTTYEKAKKWVLMAIATMIKILYLENLDMVEY